jgi:tripartite-type tricarboxylate transporter receptor subunit TctC
MPFWYSLRRTARDCEGCIGTRLASATDPPSSFGAGGGTDIVGRILADAIQDRLGKPAVVENRADAGGTLGDGLAANATPDGYTLGTMTAGQIDRHRHAKEYALRYFSFDAGGSSCQHKFLIVTRPDFPASNAAELVAAGKAEPRKIILASPNFAATQHFAGELFTWTRG